MGKYYKNLFTFFTVIYFLPGFVSNAVMVEDSPANSLKASLNIFLPILTLFIFLFLLVSILRYLFSKKPELKKKLKVRIYRRIMGILIICGLMIFIRFYYCNFMVFILGKENNFFNMELKSCNSFMGCPDMSKTFQCDQR